MASLLLLRHGRIRANRQGRWHGSTDSPLDWRGRRQVSRTARHIARAHPDLTAIYTSPLGRCVETARVVGQQLDLTPVVTADLREYAIGDWEDLPFRELAEMHGFFERVAREPAFAPPGGDSLIDVASRTVAALRSIHDAHGPEERVLLVGHGAAFGVALGSLLSGDPTRWTDFQVANCSLTELMLSPAPYVNFFNSTQHL
ncbi:MAG: histidine phosphatase family protein [Pseudomonadales bacterium]|jgi:probable phosphoglycerate mutase